MFNGHFNSAGASIKYGNADPLFPVEDLDATLYQHRDAELALADVDSSHVIVIGPTSLATSYHLGEHNLTAISVNSLSTAVQDELDPTLDAAIETFDLIQIGQWVTDSPNHSLTEFTGP